MDQFPDIQNNDRRTIYAALIIVATLAVFFPTIHNGFTNWDDGYYLVNNPDIRSLSLQNIAAIFSSFYVAQYVPLVVVSFAVEYHFFGLDPFVVHFTSLFVHLITTILVFTVVKRWKFSDEVAFMAALLFGIHPLHVEAVAWTSARKDILSSFFLFGSMLSYYRFEENGSDRRRYYILSLFLFLAAIGSKATVMFLPFFFLAEAFLTGKTIKTTVRNMLPFVMISVFFAGLVIYSLGEAGGLSVGGKFTPIETFSIASYDIIFYLSKTLIPAGLSSVYPFPLSADGTLSAEIYIAAVIFIFAAAACIIYRKILSVYSVPLAFSFFALLPTLQLVSFGSMIAADRFMYVPLLGLLAVFASLFHRIFFSRWKNVIVPYIVFGAIACAYGAVTWQRVPVWRDSETLWTDAIEHFPEFPISYFSRGQHYFTQLKYDKAFSDFNTAVELAPNYPHALNMRGYLSAIRGDRAEAKKDFNKVIELQPAYSVAYYNRGLVFMGENVLDSAIIDLTRAIALDSLFIEAYLQRGIVLTGKKEYQKAEKDLSRVIAAEPENGQALFQRGVSYLNSGKLKDALNDLQKARAIQPERKEIALNLSRLYSVMGRRDSAQYYFDIADELR
jgi:tetratricopeptide (TPR) repeat protein